MIKTASLLPIAASLAVLFAMSILLKDCVSEQGYEDRHGRGPVSEQPRRRPGQEGNR